MGVTSAMQESRRAGVVQSTISVHIRRNRSPRADRYPSICPCSTVPKKTRQLRGESELMIVTSSLCTSDDASPALAVSTVQAALDRAGLRQAQEVILFMTPEFSRQASATLTAVTRAAGCLQVFGCIGAGVITDQACAIDRPAVAVLILADIPTDQSTPQSPDSLTSRRPSVFSLCGKSHLPDEWINESASGDGATQHGAIPRFGMLYNDAMSTRATPVWQGGRLAQHDHASLRFPGFNTTIGLSTGVSTDSPGPLVEAAEQHELIRLGGCRALDSLRDALPPSLRQQRPLPVHCVTAVLRRHNAPPERVPILSANGDGSVTLAAPIAIGDRIAWSLRLPANTESDMRRMLDELSNHCPQPDFGLFLSCIGRGPFFYAGEDRDWALLRHRFPGMPFVGAYGSGQILSSGRQLRLLQNSVITALFSA